MGHAALRTGLTPEAYLEFERGSPEKHEYADGEIFAMSGGTMEHSATAANLIREIGVALYNRGCRVFTSDMRVKIAAAERYVYPDVTVVCQRPSFEDDKRDNLLNPKVIIEVLSDSSEAYDRGDKFAHYRTIPSLEEYVLASQKEPRIEIFSRQPDGSWLLRIHNAGDKVTFASLDCTIEVDRVYADVFLSADA